MNQQNVYIIDLSRLFLTWEDLFFSSFRSSTFFLYSTTDSTFILLYLLLLFVPKA